MKKILVLIAAISLIVACGGNSGKSGKSQMTVEEKTVNYLEKLSEAEEDLDYEKYEKLFNEMEAWYNGLSTEDQAKADAAAEKYIFGESGDNEGLYEDDDHEYYKDDDKDDDEGDEYYEDDEDDSVTAADWDALLDQYEDYVDEIISLYKDAMAGDMDALTKYASIAEDAAALCENLEGAYSEMTASQASRLAKITQKYAESLQ